jgi:hypothetical protein
MIPVGHVLTDANNELPRYRLSTVDVPKRIIDRGQLEHPSEVNSSTSTMDGPSGLQMGPLDATTTGGKSSGRISANEILNAWESVRETVSSPETA